MKQTKKKRDGTVARDRRLRARLAALERGHRELQGLVEAQRNRLRNYQQSLRLVIDQQRWLRNTARQVLVVMSSEMPTDEVPSR